MAVAGRLGWSAAGLAVLARGFRSPAVVVNAYRRPEPECLPLLLSEATLPAPVTKAVRLLKVSI